MCDSNTLINCVIRCRKLTLRHWGTELHGGLMCMKRHFSSSIIVIPTSTHSYISKIIQPPLHPQKSMLFR